MRENHTNDVKSLPEHAKGSGIPEQPINHNNIYACKILTHHIWFVSDRQAASKVKGLVHVDGMVSIL